MNLMMRRTITGAALGLAMIFGISVATTHAQYRDYDWNRNNDQGRWSKERTRDYAFKLGYHQAYSEAGEARSRGYRVSVKDLPGYHNDTNGYLAWMGYRDDYRDSYRKGYESGAKDAWSGRDRRYGRREVEEALGERLKDVYADDWDYENRNSQGGWRDRRDNDDWRDRRNNDDWRDRRNNDDWRDRRSNDDWRNGRGDVSRIAQQVGYRDGLRSGEDDRQSRRRFDYEHDGHYRDALSGYRSEYGNRDRYRDAYREGFRRGYNEGYRRAENYRGRWPF